MFRDLSFSGHFISLHVLNNHFYVFLENKKAGRNIIKDRSYTFFNMHLKKTNKSILEFYRYSIDEGVGLKNNV